MNLVAGSSIRKEWLGAAALVATSVPFLVLSRQCRYFSPCALFSLLGLIAYYQMVRGRRWAAAAFASAQRTNRSSRRTIGPLGRYNVVVLLRSQGVALGWEIGCPFGAANG
jgi:hypothetical protein